MREMPAKTASGFDLSTITDNSSRGAGDRLGRILEETKPVWMGRRRPIPGDFLRVKSHELQQIRAALQAAIEIIDRVSPQSELPNEQRKRPAPP